MSEGRRLGDVIRVVGALGPLDDDDLELVSRLLPYVEPDAREAGARAAAVSASALSPPAPAPPAPSPAPSPVAAARRRWLAALRLPRLARFARLNAEFVRRRPWILPLAALVLLLFGAAPALGAPGWIGAIPLVALAAVAAAIAAREVAAWRRNPLLRSAALAEGYAPAAQVVASAGGSLRLETARWRAPAPPDPLVPVGRQRALAIGMASALVPGPLDLRRLVEDVAAGRAGRIPPRELRRSLRRGVQLVIDRGPALDPFRDDIALLERWLRRVASDAGTQIVDFECDPRVVTPEWRPDGDEIPSPTPYRELVPVSGGTVVVITDLGIARPRSGPQPAPPAAWRRQHRLIRQAGCRAVYLVPYPPERWPAPLVDRLPIVFWRDGLRLDQVAGPARQSRRGTRR